MVFFGAEAFGPTNNCVGVGNVLKEREARVVVFVVEESFAGRSRPKASGATMRRPRRRPEVLGPVLEGLHP